jgi:mannan endo-1,4-beta-mannosidase
VQLWDDLFAMCEERGLRILLTPYDTFWMWNRWSKHPYNERNGGPCKNRSSILLCPETRKLIKARLGFAAERWGGSGALFAWDLWNEIHPSYAGNRADCFSDFITDLSEHIRSIETRLYGRAHPQTVSMFGPHLALDPKIPEAIFRHPQLDFASVHFYEQGTIDFPLNTVDAALSVARLMRESLVQTPPDRPFFDSESGPIHTFKDHHKTLPERFDDEYFRHMQWAHFAAGGAGGGMRWPNRKPHSLTPGMRRAQAGLARFLPLIDWRRFRRRNLNEEIRISNGEVRAAGCGDERQAVVWLVRTGSCGEDGMMRRDARPVETVVEIPGLAAGEYRVTAWDTEEGAAVGSWVCLFSGTGAFRIEVPGLVGDLALAVAGSPRRT